MNKMSVKTKLGMGFGALLLVTLLVAGSDYRAIVRINDATDVAVGHVEAKVLSNALDSDVLAQDVSVRGFLLAGDEESVRSLGQQRKDFAEHMEAMGRLLATEEGKKLHSKIQNAEDHYSPLLEQEIELRRKGQTKEAVALAFSPQAVGVKKDLSSSLEKLGALSDNLRQSDGRTECIGGQRQDDGNGFGINGDDSGCNTSSVSYPLNHRRCLPYALYDSAGRR